MSLGTIMNGTSTGYSMLPKGSRIDLTADHIEQMRRHEIVGTYRLPLFLKDVMKMDGDRHIVTTANLPLHLRSLRVGECKALDTDVSVERVREMILEIPFDKDDLAKMDPGIVKELGLTATGD